MTKKKIDGGLLRAVRMERMLSIRALAERANVNKSTIQRIESGEVSPSVDILERILAAMELSLEIVDEREKNAAQK